MKPKTIHRLYSEDPNGTPEEFPEKFKWLERCIRSLQRAKDKSQRVHEENFIEKMLPEEE